MRKSAYAYVAMAIFMTTAVAACSSTRTAESTGEYVDDSALTTKVKAALLQDSGLKSFNVGVETFKNAVQLSGFVNSTFLNERAGNIAGGVKGVESVKTILS